MLKGEEFYVCLSSCQWQVFGTLTFASQRLFRDGVPGYWRMMRYCCQETGAEYSRLLMVVRTELGEATGRFHLHFLLGGLPEHTNVRSLCGKLDIWWRKSFGIAQIRPFAAGGGDLVGYMLKTLSSGDVYELNKFGKAAGGELILSDSVFRVVRRNRVFAERQFRKQCRSFASSVTPCVIGGYTEANTPY